MKSKIKNFCFLVVCVSLFLSCASSQHLAEIETSKIQGADLDKIITEIVAVIAEKFYNFETKRVISVKISDTEGTYKNDHKIPAYITHKFTKKIEKDFLQIKLVEKNHDCKLKINLFEKAEKPNIFISLVDSKDNTFSSTTYEISESEFSNPEYNNFETVSLKKTVHLKIHYQSMGTTKYDSNGKLLRDSTRNNTQNSALQRFPEKELNKISALIDKYSKYEIVEMLISKGSITTQIDGEFKVLHGRPSLEYVNSKTIYLDFKKNCLSIIDAEKTLLVDRKRKEEQRGIANERELAEKRAREELNYRRRAEKKRKDLEKQARFARDQKTQVLPSDYHLKIRKYLKRLLFDPESLQISKISKPLQYVIIKNYRHLLPGNIVYKCEVCYNAKNRFGGYVGVQCYDLIFRDGEVIDSW